jgi:phosphoribosyl 1,2-cyclic phosphate phosphodiesterase
MKCTILGSGSSYGTPIVGGDWGLCDPNEPKNRRTTPSILIESDTTKILIDIGPDYREQSIRHQIKAIDALVLTHIHADHILGYFQLPKMVRYFAQDLPCYATKETQSEVERVFHYLHDNNAILKFDGKARYYWKDIIPYRSFKVGDIELLPLLQHHGCIDSLGFRCGNFAYNSDFNELTDQTLDCLQGIDTWLIECNGRHRVTEPEEKHLYLEKALELINRVKPQRAILTHLNITMDYDSISRMLPQGVELAYDGLVITL